MNELFSLLFIFSPVIGVLVLFFFRSETRVPLGEIHAVYRDGKISTHTSGKLYYYFPKGSRRVKLTSEINKLELPEFRFLDKNGHEIFVIFDGSVQVTDPNMTVSREYEMGINRITEVISRGIENTFQSYVNLRTIFEVQAKISDLETNMIRSINETIRDYGYLLDTFYVSQLNDLGKHTTQF